MVIYILAAVGLCFGSFVNALVWRLKKQADLKTRPKKSAKKTLTAKDLSIAKGRSMCTHCHHVLSTKDLIPVLSWISLRGKCRYCGKKIEDTPLPELLVPLLFIASYIWWPFEFNAMGTTNFVVWCALLVGFVALLIYDVRWLILPNRIMYPLIGLSTLMAILNISVFSGGLTALKDVVISLLIAFGFFYVLFQASKGKWIGGGDVKFGLIVGLIIGVPLEAFLVLFFASLIGTVVIVPGLVTKRLTAKTHVPFGPFLIIATIIVKLFGASLVRWYRSKFLLY